jgi:hypothetical protein
MALIKLNNRGVRNVSTFGSVGGGSLTFIKKLTASSDDTISFVDGTSDVVLDSTYKEYLFTFNNIHPETDNTEFSFQGNAAGGSGYNETITSTFFQAFHNEADTDTGLQYSGSADLAQGTGFQNIVRSQGSDNDQSVSGYLRLFNPSSTTFVKHFLGCANQAQNSDATYNTYFAGYFNTTSAIDEIQFKMSSDAIDAGDICLYGIK